MNTATINKLLTALNECTEWGQVSINKKAKYIEKHVYVDGTRKVCETMKHVKKIEKKR
jgi:hypothetical protein